MSDLAKTGIRTQYIRFNLNHNASTESRPTCGNNFFGLLGCVSFSLHIQDFANLLLGLAGSDRGPVRQAELEPVVDLVRDGFVGMVPADGAQLKLGKDFGLIHIYQT